MKIFFLILFLTPVFAGFSTSSQVDTAVLMNIDTGAILYEKQAHKKVFPASVTKIATALYALDQHKASLDQLITIDRSILKMATMHEKKKFPQQFPSHTLEPDGTSINLFAGEDIYLRTLFYGLLLGSGNDAANAIAYHCTGDIPKFVEQMNTYLQSIGCKNTHFTNPHGLHHTEHVTTAYDLAIMTRKAMSFPVFAQIVKTVTYPREGVRGQKGFSIVQTNRMMKTGPYFYDKALGVKTGYTSNAGYNLVSAASNGERTLIAVVLGSKISEVRYREAMALFEEAFNEKKITQRVFAKEADVFNREVKGAQDVLKAYLQNPIDVNYYPSEPYQLKSTIRWFDKTLPILPGTCVGVVEIFDQISGRLLEREELVAKNFVAMTKTAHTSLWFRNTYAYTMAHKYKVVFGLFCFIAAYSISHRARSKSRK